ncbi:MULTISPECIES: OmpH family outer membrane protein [Shimia]|uniref:OmpH family outer membrane protein n=1 Tax=Shimia TaxID=573139 RepID=UPI001FB37592|nr:MULTISPECIES: OmpH family outer membrane protein [Shimia]MDV4144092.1 OmpH family outer membrane protein [Shimia sp. FJ5]
MPQALFRHLVLAAALLWGAAFAALAQEARPVPQAPILTIESDRLFAESAFGKRVAAQIAAEESVLLEENRKMESELVAEEQRLTELREEMEADKFRTLADSFDARVQQIRKLQDGKARAIVESGDAERGVFIRAAQPVLIDLMREAGAGVILERRSVLFSANAIDITDIAIQRLDDAIGDGADLAKDR